MNSTKSIYRRTFLLTSKLESAAFKLSRILALPAWVAFKRARPNPQYLDYSKLMEMRSQYPPIPKPSGEDVKAHQLKWARRVIQLSNQFGVESVLEIGSGQGIAAQFLRHSRLDIYASDIQDILTPETRNVDIKFSVGDVCRMLPFPSDSFDLAFSVNSFEHFEDPEAALDEMLRVLQPGGLLYLTFGPLYYSPWGLHANRRLGMPYPQLLFADDTIQRFVSEHSAEISDTYSEGSDKTTIGPYLNSVSLSQYRRLFRSKSASLRLLAYTERTSFDGISVIMKYPGIIKSFSPTFEDLIVSGIKLFGVKMAH